MSKSPVPENPWERYLKDRDRNCISTFFKIGRLQIDLIKWKTGPRFGRFIAAGHPPGRGFWLWLFEIRFWWWSK